MIFEKSFNALMERLDQGLACLLMGTDGIHVVSVIKPGVELDLELMGAEISVFVNQLRKAAFASQFGQSREVVIRSSKTKVLLRVLTDDYFVALVMSAEATVGKGRFLLDLVVPEILEELE